MITVTRLLQAVMAITAMIWFTLYEQSFVNFQLSVYVSKSFPTLGPI